MSDRGPGAPRKWQVHPGLDAQRRLLAALGSDRVGHRTLIIVARVDGGQLLLRDLHGGVAGYQSSWGRWVQVMAAESTCTYRGAPCWSRVRGRFRIWPVTSLRPVRATSPTPTPHSVMPVSSSRGLPCRRRRPRELQVRRRGGWWT
jgi:hypothetical protein